MEQTDSALKEPKAMDRRGFITGLIALGVSAPAIVRAGSLMPVKVMITRIEIDERLMWRFTGVELPPTKWRMVNQGWPPNNYLNDLVYHA
jgi:hypothetical protein